MTTKEDVIAGIEAVDARLERLGPAMVARAEVPLLESEWNVRQALSHLAARGNSVPLALTIGERLQAAQAQGLSPSARAARGAVINQGQIDDRENRGVPDLLTEIRAGHQAAIVAVREMDPETFERRLPRFTAEGDMSLGEMVLRAGPGHENEHLDQIERVLGG